MVAMRISMVAINNYNYQKKPQLPILTEPILDPSIAYQSMDNYTMLKVSNSYSRLSNPITIYVTYN